MSTTCVTVTVGATAVRTTSDETPKVAITVIRK